MKKHRPHEWKPEGWVFEKFVAFNATNFGWSRERSAEEWPKAGPHMYGVLIS